MKKVISVFICLFLMLMMIGGCSSNKKSEEELREEIKAELKAELAEENSKVSEVDMNDMDALYEFVKCEIMDITRETFNTWEVSYFDITGDGTQEALVNTYGEHDEQWYNKLEIISGDSGQYKQIPSDICLGNYNNVLDLKDGFFTVTAQSGGTGEHFDDLSLYIYNGSEMINVLTNLTIKHEVAFPNADFQETGAIDGKLTDFTYTLTKYDNLNEKETIEKKEQYTYNANTMSFDIKAIAGKTANGNQTSTKQSGKDSGGQLYLSDLKNGDDVGGGLTIRDIDYKKGGDTASYTLTGNAVLTGELSYDAEYWGGMILNVTDDSSFSAIVMEGPYDMVIDYKPDLLFFRNEDTLLNAISASDINEIKNNGRNMNVKISVKDICVTIRFESDGDTSCEFAKIIDGHLN